ncbi:MULTISPECIES: ABC transporter ATP-binding protein [Methylocaldum]|uniref:ABC transporter ATP-binding protein n=1 Tax=unclassified Methylocaldum TaxID=2622260 RepID=UPI001B4764BF|nr:ABC transporter ATP-binding protein [Methylocaldum sp. 14B]MBP1150852.1 iron(III) transport system ATP-binding protein [Methylocaldum sp. RMAD-M]
MRLVGGRGTAAAHPDWTWPSQRGALAMSAVEFRQVWASYRGKPAVRDFSLDVEAGERVVLLGPSGCGKTTVLRLAAGFRVPERGAVLLDGAVAAEAGRLDLEPEQRGLGMVFQDLALWPHLTVRGNLEFGLKAQGVARAERERRIRETLRLVRLESRPDARPGELSGGEQQRVALARALVTQPRLLLMDEPLSSLDFELALELRREILALQEALGFTLLYVTHNLDEAFAIAQRIVVMRAGAIVRQGSVEEIRAHFDQVRRGLLASGTDGTAESAGVKG